MANSKIEEIRKTFATKLKKDTLDDSLGLKDLGLDSLDVVEMCLDLEEKYGIKFTTEELTGFKTAGDLMKSIESKIN